jgi:hypothetical protein
MTPNQLIGYCMAQTSAVTNIVSTRIYGGTRLPSSVVPAINYFQLSSQRKNGFEYTSFTINCRAVTAETALSLARTVTDLFHGTSSTGIYGNMNNFEITRASLRQTQGLIPETSDNLFNAPVDIFVVYPSSSVS